ncbi:MAG: endonuclease/exonuclease/phosphatase family protein [Ilumatobacter sp.]|nr:endonuclease/exonuclease/phosphatase family protein [Ilumatobacter sp.]MCB0983447.1 endonuclease/exonuclease/phosphatase family protein [Ilumatobacter sp.]
MGMTWRVLTWNLLGAKHPPLTQVAAHIRHCEPDVVALQEVRRGQARRLARLLGWKVAWRSKHYPYGPLVWWTAEGMAILSPTTVSAPVRRILSVGEPMWIYRRRIMISATVTRPDGSSLRVHNIHLVGGPHEERVAQAARVAAAVRSEGDLGPIVVCGDLNAPDGTEVLAELATVGVEDTGGTVTNPSEAPDQRLDYVLVPAGSEVLVVDTPDGSDAWREISDHLPVLVEFR